MLPIIDDIMTIPANVRKLLKYKRDYIDYPLIAIESLEILSLDVLRGPHFQLALSCHDSARAWKVIVPVMFFYI